MRLRRTSLMASVAMRHQGIMNAEGDQQQSGGGGQGQTQQSGGNNQQTQQGNSTTQGQQGNQTGNNSSQNFDPAAFWAKSDPGGNGSSQPGGSAESGQSGSGNQQQQGNQPTPQAQLIQAITDYKVPDVFTKEIGDQIANGDLKGVNESIRTIMQQSMQQTLQWAAQMMKMYGNQQESGFQKLVEDRFGSRDNNAALSKEFPSYNQPGMAPVIDSIFAKAMQNTKNDRTAALNMTKEMLKFVGTAGAQDLGLNNPPGSPNDSGGMTASAKSLVDELLSGN